MPPCGGTVCISKYGWPQGAMNPKPWQHQCPTLFIKLCTLNFPRWELLCLFHDWLPPFVLSSHEEHAKWLIYDCGFLCLTSTSTSSHLIGNQLYLLVKTWISLIQTHNLEIFSISRSDYTIPISYTGEPWVCASLKYTEVYQKIVCMKPSPLSKCTM